MTPLAKRLPRELRRNIGKYLGIFLLMCGSIALTSGFLLAAHSIGCLIDDMRDAYTIEDGRVTTSFEATKDQLKAAEKRMAEIAVLRTHIVNYAKTRDTYVAYRKAGYSKKFREEHEEEILLHQAAKNAFDEMGVKKLPKVKELQAEYARLLEEKKKTYAEYRRSREEMRELLTAKANVDRLLKMDEEQKKEQEKDHGQR